MVKSAATKKRGSVQLVPFEMPKAPEYSHPGIVPLDFIKITNAHNSQEQSELDLDKTELAPVAPNLHILVKDEEVISEPESRQIEVPEIEETSLVEANAY